MKKLACSVLAVFFIPVAVAAMSKTNANGRATAVSTDSVTITKFEVPAGSFSLGDVVTVKIGVRNTGNLSGSFWVDLSFAHNTTTNENWPAGWYDIQPVQTNFLSPGQEQEIVFSVEIPKTFRSGQYYARSRVWSSLNDTLQIMANELDGILNYPQWVDNSSLGKKTFYLPPVSNPSDTTRIAEQLAYISGLIEKTSLEDQYYTGKKPLLFLKTSKTIKIKGIPINIDGGIFIDLADLVEITPEGKAGWTTIWVGSNLGEISFNVDSLTKLPFDAGLIIHDFDYAERGLADVKDRVLDVGQLNLLGTCFSAAKYSPDDGWEGPSLDFCGTKKVGITFKNGQNALSKYEIESSYLIDALSGPNTVQNQTLSINQYVTNFFDILDVHGGFPEIFKDFTNDDGDWRLANEEIAANLKMHVINNNWAESAHWFRIEVPAGASNLKFSTTYGRGDVALLYKYGSRPNLHLGNADHFSYHQGTTQEEITVKEPRAGDYYIAIATGTVEQFFNYEGVRFTASYDLPAALLPAPSNLNAKAVSASQINLIWQDNSTNENGFKIERKSGDGAWSEIAIVDPNLATFNDTELVPNSPYSYRVRAYNANGNSLYSNVAGDTTLQDVSTQTVLFNIPVDLSGIPGETLDIPLIIDPKTNSVGSFDAQLSFDTNLLNYNSYSAGSNISDWTVDINPNNAPGSLDIAAFRTSGNPISQPDTIAVFSFTISATADTNAQISLNLSNLAATDENASELFVAGNNGLLTITSTISIAGRLNYFSNYAPLFGDTVKLVDQLSNGEKMVVSESDGGFLLENTHPGQDYSLIPQKIAGGYPQPGTINAGDALKAFRGRLGGPEPLISGYEVLAADVNGDQTITSGDALAILKRATGTFPNFRQFGHYDWRFIDAKYQITPENAFFAPGHLTYDSLAQYLTNQNFIGIILGDVNGSYGSSTNALKTNTSANPLSISIKNRAFSPNVREIDCMIQLHGVEKQYNSFDLSLEFGNELTLTGIASGSLFKAEDWLMDWNANEPGILRISAFSTTENAISDNGTLLIIHATLRQPIQENRQLTVDLPLAQFGFNGDEVLARLETGTLELTVRPSQYELYQNFPNPFNPVTTIRYDIPEAGNVNLVILDLLGRTIRTLVAEDQEAGTYVVRWDGLMDDGTAASSGLYFYRLEAGGAVITKKLIMMR